ncbi:SAM-dependent methyltransferase [Aggregicoccus sp. 17bor-14]|uniref:SAM-dependent methyltransferase n=1 Tax=Myxococcaceae TaxID=31 RepID=UPI00129C2EAE|nr:MULTISPECIES: SAM-dependent methyltransferase [Myxococcaceae]MBF5041135.1 SAM-dependent methyltransferase [Simulacricoccus sp. 17bor-14]MRI86922.1 SAM-dependent methyltransferase [Aggregicoccus sp. 17bor-14]
MSPDEPLPHVQPAGARQAFASEEATRRFAKVALLAPGDRVLLLGGCGEAPLVLARDYGCQVVAAAEDPQALQPLQRELEAQALGHLLRVCPLEGALEGLEEGGFQGVLVRGERLYRTREAAERLRSLLAPDGRLGLVALTCVGRSVDPEEQARWEAMQGAPLLGPLALLALLRDAGYEPEAAEALAPAELEALAQAEASEEPLLRAWREEGGRGGVSYALVMGRRREPGERPPMPHDRG